MRWVLHWTLGAALAAFLIGAAALALPPGARAAGHPDVLPFSDITKNADAELKSASVWADEHGIFRGYEDGKFRPAEPVRKRHVALVARRSGIPYPSWEHDYGWVTRGMVDMAIPGLPWDSDRWDEGLTRSQLLRLMFRARESIDPDEVMAARLDAWFEETRVTWKGTTRSPRLCGYGELIVSEARAHNVPIWLALGQCWRESQWGTTGLSVHRDCLWGVKDAMGRWGEIKGIVKGFADYVTVPECIRAYFALMDGVYREFIDGEAWSLLLNKYAPASENDTTEHYQIVMIVREWCEARGIR